MRNPGPRLSGKTRAVRFSARALAGFGLVFHHVAESGDFIANSLHKHAKAWPILHVSEERAAASTLFSWRHRLPTSALSKHPVSPIAFISRSAMWRKSAGLETYVLRFWESQFSQLKPNKSGTGQRLYRRREVEDSFSKSNVSCTARDTRSPARDRLSIKTAAARLLRSRARMHRKIRPRGLPSGTSRRPAPRCRSRHHRSRAGRITRDCRPVGQPRRASPTPAPAPLYPALPHRFALSLLTDRARNLFRANPSYRRAHRRGASAWQYLKI